MAQSAPADLDALALRGSYAHPAPPPSLSPDPDRQALWQPFFLADWAVALRGGIVRDSSGTRFETLLSPTLALVHDDRRADLNLSAGADLEYSQRRVTIKALHGSLAGTYRLDRLMSFDAGLDLSVGREDAGSPTLSASVSRAPLAVSGAATLSATRHFARSDLTVRTNLERDTYGETAYSDGTVQSNADQNRWVYGGGLRFSHPLSPIVSGFADVSAARERFDAASPDFGAKLDGMDYAARAGLTGTWGSLAEAEFAIGYGRRTFDAGNIAPVDATLYNASVTLHPDRTLTLGAAFTTAIRPAGTNAAGSAEIRYDATATADYKVNDWLALRASAGWYSGRFAAVGGSEQGYSAGIGADYRLSRHVTLTADYSFQHDRVTPNPAGDTHTVLVGLTVSR